MNEQTDGLDHADEELFTSTLSDEALEAAAATERQWTWRPSRGVYCC
jgi:hypothetical protein